MAFDIVGDMADVELSAGREFVNTSGTVEIIIDPDAPTATQPDGTVDVMERGFLLCCLA